ncbi:hypothetical protein STCU_02965 [Strigomonas culicis]|uniref:Uncharacterized protein n=1 Tax=Strigomonas culicis TaxID=28005 RepID=S9UMS4_9TRYP|nr:hypothetical protein STCU_02965 [Strigomonas culicis]|eukprot:EPY32122.1 hypothetical protein STCU_02965 [Strigomonas culicis]
MNSLEKQVESAWKNVDQQKDTLISEHSHHLQNSVDEELRTLLQSVRQLLDDDGQQLEKDVDKLQLIAQQFREGVEMWQQKAQSSVKAIEEKQRVLSLLVEDVSVRTEGRRESLIQRQQQRVADTEDNCFRVLQGISS